MEFSGFKYIKDSENYYTNNLIIVLLNISNMIYLKDVKTFDEFTNSPYIIGYTTKKIGMIGKNSLVHIEPYYDKSYSNDGSNIIDKVIIHWIEEKIILENPDADIFSDNEYVNNIVYKFSLNLEE